MLRKIFQFHLSRFSYFIAFLLIFVSENSEFSKFLFREILVKPLPGKSIDFLLTIFFWERSKLIAIYPLIFIQLLSINFPKKTANCFCISFPGDFGYIFYEVLQTYFCLHTCQENTKMTHIYALFHLLRFLWLYPKIAKMDQGNGLKRYSKD